MSTGPNSTKPFASVAKPSTEQLEAYLAGRLSGTEAHAIERALEEDALLREALEGLQEQGALNGLKHLDDFRPKGPRPTGPGPFLLVGAIAGMAVVAGIWLVVSPLLDNVGKSAVSNATQEVTPVQEVPTVTNGQPPLDAIEIATAVEQPESLRIDHVDVVRNAPDREVQVPVERETGVQPIASTRPAEPVVEPVRTRPERAARASRQLLYLHDLKLVHPKELYSAIPDIDPAKLGVPAQYTDRSNVQRGTEEQRLQAYTAFMDVALAKFARNDHKGCLDDLRFLLDQYPDDVNALFYAGLCSHNLALYGRARNYLHRAATHNFDTFYEEAVWYHALTLERMGEVDAAQEAYARIVAENGFYADRARSRQP
jgi:tetratricopeptide (TPR) repeat protein